MQINVCVNIFCSKESPNRDIQEKPFWPIDLDLYYPNDAMYQKIYITFLVEISITYIYDVKFFF